MSKKMTELEVQNEIAEVKRLAKEHGFCLEVVSYVPHSNTVQLTWRYDEHNPKQFNSSTEFIQRCEELKKFAAEQAAKTPAVPQDEVKPKKIVIVDDVSDDEIVIQNSVVGDVTNDTYNEFVGAKEDGKEVVFEIKSKDEKKRIAELMEFVSSRIIAAVQAGWKTDFILKHTAKMLVELTHSLGLPALNNADSNALGLWKKAKSVYMRDQVLAHVSSLNAELGIKAPAHILNPEKPRFTTALFNSLAGDVENEVPSLDFVYKAGRKEETFRYDDALGLQAVKACKAEIAKIKAKAKSEKRDLTDVESADVTELNAQVSGIWAKFFEGSKTAIANANKMFPESIKTGRTTTSGVFKSASTYNSISFGVFEL